MSALLPRDKEVPEETPEEASRAYQLAMLRQEMDYTVRNLTMSETNAETRKVMRERLLRALDELETIPPGLMSWFPRKKQVEPEPISCRSEEGVTIGLVDSIITAARVLRRRDLNHPQVQEALKDLQADEDVALLLHYPVEK